MIEFLSTAWHTLIIGPFLNVMLLFYAVLGDNLGLAVIAVAVIVRVALIPSTKKQMEMTSKMSEMQPRLKKLQEQYKHNQQKLSQEQMKLYREVGYNPVGCLGSMLPQFVVLAAMIGVIRAVTDGNTDGIYPWVENFVFGSGDIKINTQFLFLDLSTQYTTLAKEVGYFSLQSIPYLLLGVAVGIAQWFSTKFMSSIQNAKKPAVAEKKGNKNEPMDPQEMQAQMMKSMNLIFPLLTVWISLSAPAVLGLYWLVQSLMMFVQYIVVDKDKSIEVMKKIVSRVRPAKKASSKE
ncbi:MAG: YidC/Oxa1 family membrane protein insertase [Candidatus Dojkabacteria bacterium]|nr:MAG: YidC/Oxa1 family membrane protein insertase [Candidatus Dojkabacteria bacterium]